MPFGYISSPGGSGLQALIDSLQDELIGVTLQQQTQGAAQQAQPVALAQQAAMMTQQANSTQQSITALQQTASTATASVTSGNTVHAQLQAQIDAVTGPLSGLTTSVAQLTAALANKNKTLLSHGDLAIPAINLASTRVVDVPLSQAMPDTSYDVVIWVDGNQLGKVAVTGYTKTKTTVSVTLSALLAVGTGSSLHLIAIETQ